MVVKRRDGECSRLILEFLRVWYFFRELNIYLLCGFLIVLLGSCLKWKEIGLYIYLDINVCSYFIYGSLKLKVSWMFG